MQQSYIKTLEADRDNRSKETEKLIELAGDEIVKLTSNVTASVTIIEDLKNTITDSDEKEGTESSLITLIDKMVGKKNKIVKDIKFYQDNDTCPTCTQILDLTFKHDTVTCHSAKLEEVGNAETYLVDQLAVVRLRLQEIRTVKKTIAESNNVIIENNSRAELY
jgi:hypothetical protein